MRLKKKGILLGINVIGIWFQIPGECRCSHQGNVFKSKIHDIIDIGEF